MAVVLDMTTFPKESALTLPIQNKKGIHARAAAKFVKTVERFEAHVTVCKVEGACSPLIDAADRAVVSGHSILGLMMLAAEFGSSVCITASGPQSAEVLAELRALLERRFDEE